MNGEVLCEVYRGNQIESVHLGLVAVVQNGKLVYSKGDPSTTVYLRSAMKPLQAYTVLATGAHDTFNLAPAEIAIMCASHEASAEQVAAAQGILAKAKIKEDALLCGAHTPQNKETAAALIKGGKKPSAIHNNCSGKHAGMLAACKAAGWPTAKYTAPDHPLQRRNAETLARFTGISEKRLKVGIDGCSAPTFALPLERIAIAFESFFSNRADDRGRLIKTAMASHPHLIGQSCSKLIEAGRGQIFCKIGAEGVYGVAIPDSDVGIAIKNLDGSFRPLVPLIHALCKRLKLVKGKTLDALSNLADGVQRNWAGLVTGKLVPKL
jgi:L-asparaginase II